MDYVDLLLVDYEFNGCYYVVLYVCLMLLFYYNKVVW